MFREEGKECDLRFHFKNFKVVKFMEGKRVYSYFMFFFFFMFQFKCENQHSFPLTAHCCFNSSSCSSSSSFNIS